MIYLLIGQIASGKSTFAKEKAKQGCVIINDDTIVNMIHGTNHLYKEGFKPLYKSIENHILFTSVCMGLNVVIDRALDIRKESRARWIKTANSLDTDIIAVVFKKEDSMIHAKRRYYSDCRDISLTEWEEVAIQFDKDYTEPVLEEGFSKIIYV
jgi:predicted kinase